MGKMHVFSMILPGFVSKFKMAYLILKLEQHTESMHNKLNQAEIRNKNIRNGGNRLINCIQELKNRKKCDVSLKNLNWCNLILPFMTNKLVLLSTIIVATH